eukprot:15750_1
MEGDTAWYYHTETEEQTYKYHWVEYDSYDLDEPDCMQTRTTRVNHHGTPGDRTYWTHNWKIPDSILDIDGHDQCCVIRLRYNITTDDYQAWDSDDGIGAGLNYWNNSKVSSPDPEDDPAWVRIWEDFGLTYEDIEYSFVFPDADAEMQKQSRGYVFRNDPHVDPFGHLIEYGTEGYSSRILLQLAINTDQFGRTFQDRTHCFSVKDRKEAGISESSNAKDITLVTVQGKRGNIVQVYPATEYFFIPEPAVISKGDYVHFCWTGSNRNPENNDGQGLQGSDRSNICPLTQEQFDKEAGDELGAYGNVDGYKAQRAAGSVGDPGNSYPDWLQVPSYGMPQYYNYAPKRDLPRQSALNDYGSSSYDTENDYPYNDPYNQFYFNDKGDESQMADLSIEVLGALCTLRRVDLLHSDDYGLSDYGNMEEFDDAGTTFCIEPILIKEEGYWNFLCTRNNNFSNRSQKGSLQCSNSKTVAVSSTSTGYESESASATAKVVILPGMVEDGDTLDFYLTTWTNQGEESTTVQITGSDGGEFTVDAMVENAWMELWIPYTGKSLSYPTAWYKESAEDSWSEHSDASIEYESGTTYGVINVSEGGYYTITNEPDILAYIACILGIALFGIAFAFIAKKK